MQFVNLFAASIVIVSLAVLGCQKEPPKTGTDTKKAEEGHKDHKDLDAKDHKNHKDHKGHDHKDGKDSKVSKEEKIKTTRAKLPPEDLKLVEAQEYCPILPKNRLGALGDIVKVTLQGQPVFLCCDDCEEEAKADPKKTLTKAEELKAKVKAERK